MNCRSRLNERETNEYAKDNAAKRPAASHDRMPNSAFAAVVNLGRLCMVRSVGFAADNSNCERIGPRPTWPSLVELYRHLHQTPELSQKEKETSARMAKELTRRRRKSHDQRRRLRRRRRAGKRPGKVLLLRSDMDALPVAEQTGLPYASKVRTEDPHGATVGVMHACGHDVHMTNLVGVARYLASHRDKWSGTIVFVFQPAEETSVRRRGHAQRWPLLTLSAARLRRRASRFGRRRRPGRSATRPGFTLANVDSVDIVDQRPRRPRRQPRKHDRSDRDRRQARSSICKRSSAAR